MNKLTPAGRIRCTLSVQAAAAARTAARADPELRERPDDERADDRGEDGQGPSENE